jgi:hypothetical protein
LPQKNATFGILMMQLGAAHGAFGFCRQVNLRGGQHADQRRGEVNPGVSHVCAEKAEPSVRAGFMLMPDSGASNVW